jgi:hypothetical protein
MHTFLYKSLTNAVIITIVFLIINHYGVYLDETYDITGYQKNYLKAPVQFATVLIVNLIIMYLFSRWFTDDNH